jgi:hypothetical protein
MEHFLALVADRHGGAAGWLAAQGFDAGDLAALRSALVEEPS